MAYVEKNGNYTQYQGQSFSRALTKESGAIWEANETAYLTLTDSSNNEVLRRNLGKSVDNLSFYLLVGTGDTTELDGSYNLIVYVEDSNNSELNDVIADYKMRYITKKATAGKIK